MEIINLHEKRMEQSIIAISTKIADALELLQQTNKTAAAAEGMLI